VTGQPQKTEERRLPSLGVLEDGGKDGERSSLDDIAGKRKKIFAF
jgi:hypothetical protein